MAGEASGSIQCHDKAAGEGGEAGQALAGVEGKFEYIVF
jgi:hypothetical protein